MCSDIADGTGNAAPDHQEERGCAFVLEDADGHRLMRFCGAARRSGSAYCPEHHARCRLRGGSAAERRRLREIDALAAAVGGKHAPTARQPSAGMLRRLERAARRAFARPNRSCNVLNEADGDAAND